MAHAREKEKVSAVIVAVIIIIFAFCEFYCTKTDADDGLYGISDVVFFDVGDGDATFIKFPDGKSMIIDCGSSDMQVYSVLSEFLTKNAPKGIDYFILTYPDENHIGNAVKIIKDFNVGKVFKFKEFSETFCVLPTELNALLEEKEIPVYTSEIGIKIYGEKYYFAFLSPEPFGAFSSVYNDIILEGANETTLKNVSPVIYYECEGVRFIFTGDAGLKAENRTVENYRAGIYNLYYGNNIKLENVDILKVSDHGGKNASSDEFISLTCPENAVISCGKNLVPSKSTLMRLASSNPKLNLFRTDFCGTVTVSIISNGSYLLKTELF